MSSSPGFFSLNKGHYDENNIVPVPPNVIPMHGNRLSGEQPYVGDFQEQSYDEIDSPVNRNNNVVMFKLIRAVFLTNKTSPCACNKSSSVGWSRISRY